MVIDLSQPLHPTAQQLVDTVKEMLQEASYSEIKSENVLRRSGVSRGPLYHHFANFEELIEVAQTQIYVSYVRGIIDALVTATISTEDAGILRQNLVYIINDSAEHNSFAIRWQMI